MVNKLNYYFKYLVQYSDFYNNILPQGSKIYLDASYLYNFQSACYNLISKKDHKYFIDPETYKFQYGGDRKFFLKYMDYFEEFDDLFNRENIINLEFLENNDNFEDFYKKIIRFQKTMLAKTHMPLDYYKAIANGKAELETYNPIRNLEFQISPYFEFYKVGNDYYNLTQKYALIDTQNYCILRFPKEIMINTKNLNKIFRDFNKCKGILLDILNLSEYNKEDLKFYFENVIDLIYKFSLNGQKVILMNNSEFGKYFKCFGLNSVCSSVMIGQVSREYQPFKDDSIGGQSDYIYMPQIERAVSITNAETLIKRNVNISNPFDKNINEINLSSRTKIYYDSIKEKVESISESSIQQIIEQLDEFFEMIEYNLHKKNYEYLKLWKEILIKKRQEYSMD